MAIGKRLLSAVVAAALTLLITASGATAAEGDPTKVGDNLKDLVSANVKSFWWVCLVVGLLSIVLARKASRAAGILGMLAVSGIVIYNPAGVASFMQGVASRII